MKSLLMVVALFCYAFGSDKIYTVFGDYTYREVLNSVALKSFRSVVGASGAMDLKRHFDICQKPYHEAVRELRLDLLSDGYDLLDDGNCLNVVRDLDSLGAEKLRSKDSVFSVYLPYSKRYLFTKDKGEWINAKEIDLEKHVRDSVEGLGKWSYIYKCDLFLVGSTSDSERNMGCVIGPELVAALNVYPLSGSLSGLGLDAQFNKSRDSLNFRRHLIFYLKGDSSSLLVFGTDVRQVNSSITSATGSVSTNYEDIYDGLSLLAGPKMYRLTYRLDANQITLSGVSDSLVVGSSFFDEGMKMRSFWISGKNTRSCVTFYLASLMKVAKCDSVFVPHVEILPIVGESIPKGVFQNGTSR